MKKKIKKKNTTIKLLLFVSAFNAFIYLQIFSRNVYNIIFTK